MDFDFSQEQRQLKDEARRFLSARCPLSLVRGTLGEDEERRASQGLYKEIAELGWCGTAIPEASGGLGLGYVELCAIAEELGRALAPVPFASAIYLFAEGVMAAGSAEQRARLLSRLARGEIVGCLATAEGSGAHRHRSIGCHVKAGRLNGVKIPVIDGDAADLALVLAAEERGPSLFLADLTDPGVQRTVLRSLDPSRGVARLGFSDVPVELVGEAGGGGTLVERIFDSSRGIDRLRAARRRGPQPRARTRLCAGTAHLRTSHRFVSSDQAPARRYVRQERARSFDRLLRRVGTFERCDRAAARCGDGAGRGERRVRFRLAREHPNSWRRRCHVGGESAPLLPACTPPEPRVRSVRRMGRAPGGGSL